ncbi:MAG TPA: tetratricopeptide repeat protein [Candidatus Ozemobacteraceae bacterium]|nr:tetratricopeptide repeat protein [Candidatus Ozemobacteraceae bacterium]
MKAHKEKLKVILYTTHHKIRGEVHLYENSRLSDILNADTATKDFLPITNAELTDLRTGTTIESGFLSINRRQVEMVLEDDEAIALMKCRDMIARRRYPEALQFAQRAVKAIPKDAEAQYLLGLCLAKTGDPRAARAAFETCLKLDPNPEVAQNVRDMLNTLG